jgi:hypothetical protein
MEIEKSVKESSLPAAIMAALRKDYPKATFKDPNLVQKFYYEVDIVIDGKTHEVKVDAAGNIEDESKGKADDMEQAGSEDHGKGEKHEGKKGEKEEDDDND